MGVRGIEGDVAGQVGRDLTEPSCRPGEVGKFFLRAPESWKQVFQQVEVGDGV